MIKREIYIRKIKNALEHLPIVVLIGARQVGKTTLMVNYNYKLKSIFLNGQDSNVAELFSNYTIIKAHLELNLNSNIKGVLLIDEFQFIPNISTMLKLLVDNNKNLKIVVTGSSSLNIIQQVHESLAGRVRLINVYSLSFGEYIKFQNEELYNEFKKYTPNTPSLIINKQLPLILNSFLLYGGMPRVALAKKESDKQELLFDIYQTYLLKDIKSYVKNEESVGFNKLIRLLSAQTSNLLNVNELANSTNLKYKKVSEYLYLLEQMYIIKMLEPFYSNSKKTISKMKKVYFYDTGMRNVIYNSFNDMDIRIDNGAIFENYIFLELLKYSHNSTKINYYRTLDGSEVDFVIDNMKNRYSFEAKYKKLTKTIPLKALNRFNKTENISQSFVINLTLSQTFPNIKYLPPYLLESLLTSIILTDA